MSKSVLLIDLDRTLIDTNRMKKERLAIARAAGVPKKEAETAYVAMSRQGFDPRAYFKRVVRDPKKQAAAIRASEGLHAAPKGYNFPGVEWFLSELAEEHSLFLFTHGHRGHQIVKLRQAGLGSFFTRIVIVRSREKYEDLKYFHDRHGDRVFLLDDSSEAIASARRIGVKTVKVRTGFKNRPYFKGILNKIRTSCA